MLLAIDSGNSTTGFGFFREGRLAFAVKAQTRMGATPDEYAAFLKTHMDRYGVGPGAVKGVVVSSVVPQLVHVFFETAKAFFDEPPLLVSSRLKLGVTIKYKTPETLGSDRIAAASAAYAAKGGPVIVVDFGTATTLSVVDASGGFLGGMIAPGVLTGLEALIGRTASLPNIGLTFPKKPIGTSTGEGLQSGIIFGHASLVSGLVSMAREELKAEAPVVATGGLSDFITPHLSFQPETDHYLVMKGLSRIHSLNKK